MINLTAAQIDAALDEYLHDHWSEVLSDLETLVRIPSFRENDQARLEEGAPFGPGPRAALTAILDIAQRMGFETRDLDGYLGLADFPGEPGATKQIGIIGHVDVVPAGSGWTVEPYELTRKEGFLMGRGVIDDKGPVVVALHAMNVWRQLGVVFPYTLRFLFGAAEETGMEDVDFYQQRFPDPDFLFTPDAEFPVCYGEKGHYDGTLVSSPFTEGKLRAFQGGTAPNAVPGSAFALVACDNATTLPHANRIAVSDLQDGTVRIDATGKSRHASTPEGSINAIGLVVDYLLETDLCTTEERAFLQFEQRLLKHTDGSGFDCACSDADFGALTMVGGMISLEKGRLRQTIDCRFPTCITADEIENRILQAAAEYGVSLQRDSLMEPFLTNPQSPEVKALLAAYAAVSGEDVSPFTMGGGTYARKFSHAVSFGPERPWVPVPDWVGSMHGPDEGISKESLKEALTIYARALINLSSMFAAT